MKFNVLLVEDNTINQKVAVHILNKEGHSVQVANNGEQAIEELKKRRYDIVLMDIQMPKMDGVEVTRIIRNSKSDHFDPGIPIIALTAHAFEEDRQRFLNAGMNSCVTKPFKKEELFREIEMLVSIKAEIDETETIQYQYKEDLLHRVEALERLDGDEELLLELFEVFIDDAPKQMGLLKQAIENTDADLIERQAHSIKSASAYIGADSMREKALEIENTAKDKNINNVQTLYEGLENEFEKVLQEIEEQEGPIS